MKNLGLWAEITITGFLYLSSIFCFALLVLDQDLIDLDELKSVVAILSIGVLAASYVLGILAHRMISYFLEIVLALVRRLELWTPNSHSSSDWTYESMVQLYQYGSERLHRELDFQFSLLAFFRSLSFAVPILGTSLTLLAVKRAAYDFAIFLATVWLLLTIACFVSFLRQLRHYRGLQEAAFDEVSRIDQQK